MRIIGKTSAALLATTALAASTAGLAAPQISVAPVAAVLGEPFALRIEGQWPNRCVPELSEHQWRDRALVVFANPGREGCVPEPTDYTIELDPSATIPLGYDAPLAVRFVVGEPNGELGRLHGFEVLDLSREVDLWLPESGLWWPEQGGQFDTAGPGIALSLEFQNGQMVSMTNAYDDDGSPSWSFSNGDLDGNVVRGPLLRMFNGQSLFSGYRTPSNLAEGEVRLEFHSPATATAWLTTAAGPSETDGILLQPISLVRYAFGRSYQQFVRGTWLVVPIDDPAGSLRLVFDGVGQAKSEWVEFASLDQAAQLTCNNDAADDRRPPEQCVLSAGEHEIVFDQIGLNRLQGVDRSNRPVVAIRLD